MAGASTDFNAAEFRTNIRAAMVMGLPGAVEMRPTFRWTPNVKQTTKADVGGNPYVWSTPSGAEPSEPVQVSCAVEVKGNASGEANPIGDFIGGEALLTFLDEDFEQVIGFTEVLLGGDVYYYKKQLPPVALFDVTVHQVLVSATNET